MQFFRDIKKTTKTFLLTVLVLNIIAGAVYGFLYTRIGHVSASVEETAGRVTQLLVLQDKEKNEQHVVADTKESRKTLGSYFIKEEDAVSFIEELEDVASIAGAALRIEQVDINNAGLRVDMTVTGGWQETFHTLSLLETMPLQAVVEHASFQHRGEEGWHSSFSVLVTSFMHE